MPMRRFFAVTVIVGSIAGVQTFAFAEPQAIFDGRSGEQVYIQIALNSPADINGPDGAACDSAVECPLWTAMLWNGTDPSTVSYAGAVYNTSDSLTQSMTFTVPQGANYSVVEVIGLNADKGRIASRALPKVGGLSAPAEAPNESIVGNVLGAIGGLFDDDDTSPATSTEGLGSAPSADASTTPPTVPGETASTSTEPAPVTIETATSSVPAAEAATSSITADTDDGQIVTSPF